MQMDLLKITNDPSYPNDFINELDTLSSSILIINEVNNGDSGKELDRSFSSSSSSLRKKSIIALPASLDISRISDQLLVTSSNSNELCEFLKAKYRDRFLIWNIGPSPYDNHNHFNSRLISCNLPKSQMHTLKFLFHQCHAMLGWLELCPENVVVIQCADGWSRSGLLMSCLLKFSGAVDSTFEALNIFQSRRLKTRGGVLFSGSQNLILRYLKYFNDICNSRGRVPNPSSLCLHQIIITTVPAFDSSGSCSPGLEIFQNNELILSTACIGDKSQLSSDVYIFKDDFNIIFKLKDNSLARDIQLHIFHSDQRTGQRTTILSFTFNTAFFHPGVIRLRPEDLEIPLKDSDAPSVSFSDASTMKSGQKRFKDDFCIDLILLPSTDADGKDTSIDYVSTVRNNEAKNLLRLSQMLPIRPDRKLLPPLLLPAFPKFYCKLALQLYSNDLHEAHEFLVKMRDESSGLKDLERSFLELTKVTENSKEVNAAENEVEDDLVKGIEELALKNKTTTESELDTAATTEAVNAKPSGISNAIAAIIDTTSTNSIDTLATPTSPTTVTDRSIPVPVTSAPLPSFSGIGIKEADMQHVQQGNIPPPPPLPAPRQTNIPAAPPLPPGMAPPPPPPMPSNNQNFTNDKPRIKNMLHWNELSISAEEIDEGTKKSIWHEIAQNDFDFDAQLNTTKFEEMFCIGTPKMNGVKADNTLTATVLLPVVIDVRRANNVGIGLSRFQKRFDSFDALLQEIYATDTRLDLDDFLALKSILPTEEEMRNLKLIKKSDRMLIDRMGPAEQFMYKISTDPKEKNIASAIDFKIFALTFEPELAELKHKFGMIGKVLEALRSSEELKIILKATLDLGNLATYEYGRVNSHSRMHKRRNSAYGFTLDSLCKLHEVKSVDNQSNLLIFLTSTLAQSHPEALNLVKKEEFKELEGIKGWSDRQLRMEFDSLQGHTEEILNDISDDCSEGYKVFWTNAKQTAEAFKHQLEQFKSTDLHQFQQTWQSTKIYFGHSQNDTDSDNDSHVFADVSVFLTTIWQFFRNFAVAIKQVKKGQKNRNNSGTSSLSQSLSL